jgi:hypothetical protein
VGAGEMLITEVEVKVKEVETPSTVTAISDSSIYPKGMEYEVVVPV